MSPPGTADPSGPHAGPASVPAPGWVRRLLPWLRPYRANVAIALGAAAVGSLVSVSIPLVERQVLDRVVLAHRSPLAPWIAVMLGLAVVGFGSAYLRRFRGGRVSLDVQRDLRNAIYDRLSRLDFARHDQMQTGQLVSRATSDVGLIQALLAFTPVMAGNALLLVVATAVMVVLSPLLATVSLVAVPAMVVAAYRMRRMTFPANWDAQQKEGEVAVAVEEAVTGVRVVKGFGQERRELERVAAEAQRLYGANVRATRLQTRYQPVLAAIPQLAEVGVLVLGGWLAVRHRIPLGTFLAFASYLVLLATPARMLANVMLVAQQARAGVERVLDLLSSTPVVAERPDAVELPALHGEIRFDDVTFGYLSREPVLDGFELVVAPGETVAVVGRSGSGKSTAALLLPRFYDVQRGAVRVDGVDVRDVTLGSLRRQIGVVFEESFLFSDTVRANIAYGRPDATAAEVEQAARRAEADRFVRDLPDGYDTLVGERGFTLSGGQRQRIALARALLTDPRILLLDDATSSVDARIEEEIHATLRKVMAGRTTLLVAHRRSTLRLADRIAVVDAGRVVDAGTHEELTTRCRLYRLLLSGPGDDLEGDGAPEVDLADVAPGPEGTTPSLWPAEVAAGHAARQPGRTPGVPGAPGAGIGAGLGRHSGGGGWMGALSATPDLLARVEALPPVKDFAVIDLERESAPETSFTLRRFVRPWRAPLALGLVLVALDAAAGLAGPVLIRSGIDSGVRRGSLSAVWVAAGVFLAVVAADLVVEVAETFVTGRTAERLLLALRVKVFAHLQRLSLDFYEREMGGRVMTRMTTDIDAFSTLLETGLVSALVSIFTFFGVGVALVAWNPELAGAVLSTVVPLAAATLLYRHLSARAYSSARERIAVVNASLQEGISGIREVQAYGRQERNERQFHRLSDRYLDARLRAQRLISLYFPFVQFLSVVAAVIVLGVGSVLVAHHRLSVGELIGFVLYLDLFFSPVQQLSQTFDSYQRAGASRTQVAALMSERTLTPQVPQPLVPGRLRGAIDFRDVHFSYPGGSSEVLGGVDLEIPPGETVALVGETGAGKSTLVKLVARFYDPTGGAVLVDGHDLRDLDLTAYRRQLGYVPQEAHLFSGTVRDNIAYGRPDATDAEVESAARRVGAHSFVAGLEGGYRAWVSERGRSLSAGQRQLIALARAELVDPAVLLLDEATSTLDLATEARVDQAMSVVASERTTLLIAHRLQSARRADRVVVLDGGMVAEVGTHDQLIARDGLYARMWSSFEPDPARQAESTPA